MKRLIFFLLAASLLCYADFGAKGYLQPEAADVRKRDVDVNISQIYPQPEIPIWIHDTDRFNFTITEDGTNAYDLTGKDIYFAGKKYLSDTNFIFLIECDVDDATGGLCHADFLPTSVPTAGVYQAGIRITQFTNVIVTAWIGKLKARGVVDDGQTGWTPPDPWSNYVTFSQGDVRYGQKIPGHSNLWQSGFDDFRTSDVRVAEPTETNQPATKKYVDDSIITQVTEILYVDGNRTDTYTPNGHITKPYKTIQAAITAASGDTLLNVAPGTYDGDIGLGVNVVSIRGSGINATHFTGNLTAGDRAHSLEEFCIKATGSLTVTDNIFARNLHLQCAITVSGAGFLDGHNIYLSPSTEVVPLTVSSTGGAMLNEVNIVAGNVSAINQTAGTLVIFHSSIGNSSLTATTVNSSGGVCGLIDTSIGNGGFGQAVNLNNDGNALSANTLKGVVCSGNIDCGAATTYVEGLNFVGFGALSGSALVYRPASRLDNDSSVAGDTVKDALETLDISKIPYTDDAYIIVKRGTNDVANGTALKSAYTAAKALTPGGNALSATNRACLIIPAGRYDLGSTAWDIDADFVDVRGEGNCRWNDIDGDDKVEDGEITFPDTHIICDTDTEVVLVTVRDVHIGGLYIEQETGNYANAGLRIDNANYCDRSQFIDLGFTIPGLGFHAVTGGTEIGGYWEQCHTAMVFIPGDVSGTFKSCSVGYNSFGDVNTASGIFVDCVAGNTSFGGDMGTASGLFIDCIAGEWSFGAGGIASGTFIRCKDLYGWGFGGTTTDNGFTGETSGTFIDCISEGDCSFGGTNSSNAIMRRCTLTGRAHSVGNWQGTMENCYIEVTGANKNAVEVTGPAKLFGNTLIATGTGKSIYAASPQTVTMGGNYLNKGISTNITKVLYLEADRIKSTPSGGIVATEVQAAIDELDTEKVSKTARSVPIPLSYFATSVNESGVSNPCQVSHEVNTDQQVEIRGRSCDTNALRTAYVYSVPMTIGEYPLMPNFTSWQTNAFTYTIRTDSTNITDNLINIAICQKKDALYQTGFNTTDTPPFSVGSLDGQNDWGASGTGADVQAATIYEGDQAVQVSADGCATRSISVGTSNKRCVRLYVRPNVGGEPSVGTNTTASVYFSSAGIMCANGDHSGGISSWENTGVVPAGTQWYEITIIEDYNTHTWECWVDGTLTLAGLGLINDSCVQNQFDISDAAHCDVFGVLDSHSFLVTNLVSATAGVDLTGNIETNDVINALGDGDTFWWRFEFKSKNTNDVYLVELKANYEE